MTFNEWLFFSFGMPAMVLAYGLFLALVNEISLRRELRRQARERGE
ncbi:MAG TPA: hypothetical protein VFN28_03830 [Amaricoccus sp.]|jgi:hypothetical protein|nr:hypothetical protein [Amaricoccus sp.]